MANQINIVTPPPTNSSTNTQWLILLTLIINGLVLDSDVKQTPVNVDALSPLERDVIKL